MLLITVGTPVTQDPFARLQSKSQGRIWGVLSVSALRGFGHPLLIRILLWTTITEMFIAQSVTVRDHHYRNASREKRNQITHLRER